MFFNVNIVRLEEQTQQKQRVTHKKNRKKKENVI